MAKEIVDMGDYWQDFWKRHAKASVGEHSQYQVLRTLNKEPVSDEKFREILEYVKAKLNVTSTDDVLDLGCGNGLISTFLASGCRSVTGVDFAEDLVSQVDQEKNKNISVIVEDVRRVNFAEGSFDKIVMYAAIQYLAEKEAVLLFERVFDWLRPGGLFLVADIPDRDRVWNFFNSEERERVYFDRVKDENPIVGTWFDQSWLTKLGGYAGFSASDVLPQPEDFPYSHYRFDQLFRK